MWPFRKKIRQRRLEVRKNIPRPSIRLWQRLRQRHVIGAVLIVAAFFVGALLMDLLPTDPLPYREGQYLPRDIHSRLPFKVLMEDKLAEAIQNKQSSTPATFNVNKQLLSEIESAFKSLPERLKATTQPADLANDLKKQFGLDDPKVLKAWQKYGEDSQKKAYEKLVDNVIRRLTELPLIKKDQIKDQLQRVATEVVLVAGDKKTYRSIGDNITEEGIKNEARRLAEGFTPVVRRGVEAYLVAALENRPTYLYDITTTQRDIDEARRTVEENPPEEVFKVYEKGAILVSASRRNDGDSQSDEGLSRSDLDLLQREREAYLRGGQTPWPRWTRLTGRAVILLLLTLLMCFYIVHYMPHIVRNNWRWLAIMAVMLLMLGVSKILISVMGLNPHAAVLPVLMAAVVMVIAYDQRFALAISSILAAFVALQIRADLSLIIVLISGAAAIIFQLREIRTRSKLVEAAALTAAAVFAVIWAMGLAANEPSKFIFNNGAWGAGCALLVGFIIQGVLPLIERAFKIATSMTLLEWCDASKLLLKRLAMEAPGTYNHSLQLGTMCESAAETIGVRGLLARVGAYYHDIGKINKPEYFIENQQGTTSKHDKLSPAMSLLIIIGHVKDGLEMAREYALPRVLHEFIATHHGTTLVQYFYQQATEQSKNGDERVPDEVEFRYPGPKPYSKEAAILMLADASESSVRAMSEPTSGRIENQVHTMVNRRLMDGQLDECELTLRQVHQIEASLIKSLVSIYHSRIAYPTPAGQKPSAAELEFERKKGNGNGSPQNPTNPDAASQE